jgi:hypothetical protein
MYNSNKVDIKTIDELNQLQPSLELENKNKLNFLDITITREDNKLSFGINRKPTGIDALIHNKSCHPNEHRLAGINYLTHKLRTYPITREENEKEENITKMLKANGYEDKILKKKRHKKVENGVQKQQ